MDVIADLTPASAQVNVNPPTAEVYIYCQLAGTLAISTVNPLPVISMRVQLGVGRIRDKDNRGFRLFAWNGRDLQQLKL